MPENKGQSQKHLEQTNETSKRRRMEDWDYNKEELSPVPHKTNVTVCYVMTNELGERVYGFYIEDSEGLKEPIGLEMIVHANGSIKASASTENALEILWFLKPEYVEALEAKREEAERRAKS
jgi:hypothetical protein